MESSVGGSYIRRKDNHRECYRNDFDYFRNCGDAEMNGVFYLLMILSASITAFSQIILKISANKKHKGVLSEYVNPYVLFSYICYFGVLVLNVFIYTRVDYRYGVVINSLASVLVLILSGLMLKEKITLKHIVGNLLVISGIIIFSIF